MIKTANYIFLLLVPFLFTGMVNRTKAFWAGRIGPPLFQPLFDFLKLFRKAPIFATTTSMITQLSVPLALASVLTAALFIPGIKGCSVLAFDGDILFFTGFLALSRFSLILAALDTGSSFEGMGAAREAFFSVLVEPAFILLMGVSIIKNGYLSFSTIQNLIGQSGDNIVLIAILAAIAMMILLLTEGGRVPADDPATHLELTMISEVMVLDYSGPDLSVWNYIHSLKMVFLAVLLVGIFVPTSLSFTNSLLCLFLGLALTAIVIGSVESFIARFRMKNVPQFVLFAMVLSLLLVFILITNKQGIAKCKLFF